MLSLYHQNNTTMKLDLATLKWVLEQSTNINKWDLRQILYEEIEKIENPDINDQLNSEFQENS